MMKYNNSVLKALNFSTAKHTSLYIAGEKSCFSMFDQIFTSNNRNMFQTYGYYAHRRHLHWSF